VGIASPCEGLRLVEWRHLTASRVFLLTTSSRLEELRFWIGFVYTKIPWRWVREASALQLTFVLLRKGQPHGLASMTGSRVSLLSSHSLSVPSWQLVNSQEVSFLIPFANLETSVSGFAFILQVKDDPVGWQPLRVSVVLLRKK
jgi:hypothetical protein